jgi:hypothetical protein
MRCGESSANNTTGSTAPTEETIGPTRDAGSCCSAADSAVTEPDRVGVRRGSDDHAHDHGRHSDGGEDRPPVDPLTEEHRRCEHEPDQPDAHQRLHDNQRCLAECKKLEHDSCAIDGDRQQPQRPAQQRNQQAPARPPGSPDDARLLGHQHVARLVRQAREQSEDDAEELAIHPLTP